MATQNCVIYTSNSKLACSGCTPAEVILCVPLYLTVPPDCQPVPSGGEGPAVVSPESYQYSYIEGTVAVCQKINSSCGSPYWRYTLCYDISQIADGYTLTPELITGVFCKGCLTQWVEDKVGNDPYIRYEDDGSFTFIGPHGCEYPLTGGSSPTGSYWSLTGNLGLVEGTNFIGTLDSTPFEAVLEGLRVFRAQVSWLSGSPDIVLGSQANYISGTLSRGNVIGGGGFPGFPNFIDSGVETAAAFNVICGGAQQAIQGLSQFCFLGGGENGIDGGYMDAIVSGLANYIVGDDLGSLSAYQFNFVGSGYINVITTSFTSVVVGGEGNTITDGVACSILNGQYCSIDTASFSTILGGELLTLGDSSVGYQGHPAGVLNPIDVSAFPSIAYFGDVDTWVANTDGTARKLKLIEPNTVKDYSTTHFSSLEAQAQAADIEYIMPAAAGVAGNSLKIDSVVGNRVTLIWA